MCHFTVPSTPKTDLLHHISLLNSVIVAGVTREGQGELQGAGESLQNEARNIRGTFTEGSTGALCIPRACLTWRFLFPFLTWKLYSKPLGDDIDTTH